MTTPLFIFSLPRSGSTLLQRILASHPDIATVAEPWILLPYLYSLKEKGCYAEYGHHLMVQAVQDFCESLPNGREDYLREVQIFTERLYELGNGKNNSKYFLDKTPRYHLIVKDIITMFPDAKFIFLWRNPLSIVASNMETWARGKWCMYRYEIDYYHGLSNLVEAYQKYSDRVFGLRFEDLVTSTGVLGKLLDYLEIENVEGLVDTFNRSNIIGRMGDQRGSVEYDKLSLVPLRKWRQTFTNPIRKTWGKKYLQWIGAERLMVMGYELDQLIREFDSVKGDYKFVLSDIIRILYGRGYKMHRKVLPR